MKATEGVTEQLKEENQIEWVQQIKNIHQMATEFILKDLILEVYR